MRPEPSTWRMDRRLSAAIAASVVSLGSFGFLFVLTTQVEAIRASVPFTEDPYDLVASVAAIVLLLVVPTTAIRVIRLARDRTADESTRSAVARRVVIGLGLGLGHVTASIVADLIALATIPGTPVPIVLLIGATGIAAAAGWVAVWRAWIRAPAVAAGEEPDTLDDLLVIGGPERAPVDAVRRWLDRSQLNPRRHRVLAGIAVAAAAAASGVAWHAIREGAWASPGAATVYALLIGTSVLIGYAIVVWPLHGLRRAA